MNWFRRGRLLRAKPILLPLPETRSQAAESECALHRDAIPKAPVGCSYVSQSHLRYDGHYARDLLIVHTTACRSSLPRSLVHQQGADATLARQAACVLPQDYGPDGRCCIADQPHPGLRSHDGRSSYVDVRRLPGGESLRVNGSSCSEDAEARAQLTQRPLRTLHYPAVLPWFRRAYHLSVLHLLQRH